MSDETWDYWPEKGLGQRVWQPEGVWVDLVVSDLEGEARSWLLPEWLVDAILADHAAARQVEVMREALRELLPIARAGLVGLNRIGNDGVYTRVENAERLISDIDKAALEPAS